MAGVRFQLRGCGQVSPNVSTTEHMLSIGQDVVTALRLSYVTASHTQGESPTAPGSGNQKRRERPLDRKQEHYKANKTAVWRFLQG